MWRGPRRSAPGPDPGRRGAASCRPAPQPRAGGKQTKAEQAFMVGTAPGTARRALPASAPGGPGTRAKCWRLPAPRSGGAPRLTRAANETVPAPPRRPPSQHWSAGRSGREASLPVRGPPRRLTEPLHCPNTAGAFPAGEQALRGCCGERCKPAAGTRGRSGARRQHTAPAPFSAAAARSRARRSGVK